MEKGKIDRFIKVVRAYTGADIFSALHHNTVDDSCALCGDGVNVCTDCCTQMMIATQEHRQEIYSSLLGTDPDRAKTFSEFFSVGRRISHFEKERTRLGMSQEVAAKLLKVSQPFIAGVESGEKLMMPHMISELKKRLSKSRSKRL